MPAQILLAPQARRQVDEAVHWWRESRPAAPDLLEQQLERMFTLLASQPRIGSVVRDYSAFGEVRRLFVSRVRYHVYYRVRDESLIEVLALWHSSRGEGPTQRPRMTRRCSGPRSGVAFRAPIAIVRYGVMRVSGAHLLSWRAGGAGKSTLVHARRSVSHRDRYSLRPSSRMSSPAWCVE